MPTLVIVTNIPAPYRIPMYREVSEHLSAYAFTVIFCADKEANRDWKLDLSGFDYRFLAECVNDKGGKYIHNNPDVWDALNQLNPDVVITTGFNPTHLYAFAWAVLHRKKHIPMTDGTLESEAELSYLHRLVRRVVYRFSPVFIGASMGSMRLYCDYGKSTEHFFQSHLCANNAAFHPGDIASRPYDFMFCGRFSPEKNPLFAIDVAKGVAHSLGHQVTLLVLGSGPMGDEVRLHAARCAGEVIVTFKGFVQPDSLPELYCQAKVFLFPTSWDPWGVVANEACAAGQAVIVSPHAGVAGELIMHNDNGYVLPLELPTWVNYATHLLKREETLQFFSSRSLEIVKGFSYGNAANGIVKAVNYVALKDSKIRLADKQRTKRKTVVIVQRRLTDYRVPLFIELRRVLAKDGVELRVLYGEATKAENSKRDSGYIEWAEKLKTQYLFGNRLCWQPFYRKVKGVSLVIVTQENKLLANLWPLFGWRSYKLAFWGHGKNMQSADNWWSKLKEAVKYVTTNRVDWWFVYTGISQKQVARLGFSDNKITNLENSVDTSRLKQLCESVTNAQLQEIREKLVLGDGPVGLYVGSLYQDKRLEFLLETCCRIVEKVPSFRLIIIGDGPQRPLISDAQAEYAWLRYVGRQVDSDKARYLKLASVLLNPGLVGLGILDAFAAGIPLITTDCGLHSPEIDYLRNGENGFITTNSLEDYVNIVLNILENQSFAHLLSTGSLAASNRYTIENMAENFRVGILKALES